MVDCGNARPVSILKRLDVATSVLSHVLLYVTDVCNLTMLMTFGTNTVRMSY